MPSPDDILEALDPEQRQVAEALRGPVRVLAGAGTGKTRAITHRIAYGVASGVYAPTEVLAVTFTTRAAGELRGRLATLGAAGVQARTFHSAALRQLRYFWPRRTGHELPMLVESKLGLMATAVRRQRTEPTQTLLRDLAAEVEWAKVSNVSPATYPELAGPRGREVADLSAEQVARVYATYEEVKRDQGRMDMEDVLLFTAGMLADDERVAATIRQQYKWFVVDEYQDVSPLQAALLELWLGGRDELCVVGDPAQTIYSFAGAKASYLLDFGRKYPAAPNIELVRNYRSTPQVVQAANLLLAGTPSQSVTLRSQKSAGAAPQLIQYADEPAEASAIATLIEGRLKRGVPASEIAVLFRINAASEEFESALAARGIGYVLRGATRFFERPEVKQAITLLRAAARTTVDEGQGLSAQVSAVLSSMGHTASPPAARGNTRDRWESVQAVAALATRFEGDLSQFVADLDRRASEQHAPLADGVTLATIHAAKGLEWEEVFLAGMSDGSLPLVYATTDAEIEEERRLLYVGLTRARTRLQISWSAARHPGGRANKEPSRFLGPLLASPVTRKQLPAAGAPRKAGQARQCRVCGGEQGSLHTAREKKLLRHEGCQSDYCPALFAELANWRRRVADDKPPFTVFTDATLEAVCERLPGSSTALLSVPGVGKSKLEKYGTEVVGIVASHQPCAQCG